MQTFVFFTFYGLNIPTKDIDKRVKADRQPEMPIPVPVQQLAKISPGHGCRWPSG